jgi:serine/threonine protein kinase
MVCKTHADRNQEDAVHPGEWKKGKLLGQGAYGKVYQGLNLRTGKLLAVKEISVNQPGSMAKQAEQMRRLQQEIRLMESLEHRNIVRYLGCEVTGADDGSGGESSSGVPSMAHMSPHRVERMRHDRPRSHSSGSETGAEAGVSASLYIFTEWVPGGSLQDLVDTYGGYLPESLVRIYTEQLLQGLAYLHKHFIVHHDIKLDNVLLDDQGVVKLADFGASASLGKGGTGMNDEGNLSGRLKELSGTPYYMAPEVVRQSGHGRKADIWSLGGTILKMATGYAPWQEERFTDLMPLVLHISKTKVGPSVPASLSPHLQDFLQCCFRIDKDCRPNAEQLLQHAFLHRLGHTLPEGQGGQGPEVEVQIRANQAQQQPLELEQQQQQQQQRRRPPQEWHPETRSEARVVNPYGNGGSGVVAPPPPPPPHSPPPPRDQGVRHYTPEQASRQAQEAQEAEQAQQAQQQQQQQAWQQAQQQQAHVLCTGANDQVTNPVHLKHLHQQQQQRHHTPTMRSAQESGPQPHGQPRHFTPDALEQQQAGQQRPKVCQRNAMRQAPGPTSVLTSIPSSAMPTMASSLSPLNHQFYTVLRQWYSARVPDKFPDCGKVFKRGQGSVPGNETAGLTQLMKKLKKKYQPLGKFTAQDEQEFIRALEGDRKEAQKHTLVL